MLVLYAYRTENIMKKWKKDILTNLFNYINGGLK